MVLSRRDSFIGPRGPLGARCAFCWKPGENFARCSGCNAVRYCSPRHWIQHRQEHQSLCDEIKIGRTWETQSEHHINGARLMLADALQRTGSLEGIKEALAHMLALAGRRSDAVDTWRLHRIPLLMLQLDRDQECYDFIQARGWMYQFAPNPEDVVSRSCPEPSPPYPDPNVMAFGDLEDMTTNHKVMATVLLLHMKLLVDVIRLKVTLKAVSAQVPPKLVPHIGKFVVRSSISQQWVGHSFGALTAVQQRLEKQVVRLGKTIQWASPHLFEEMLNLEPYQSTASGKVSRLLERKEPGCVDLGYTIWWEHEGIVELLQSAKALLLSDLEESLDVKAANKPADHPQHEENGISIRFWDYFTSAVEDALSLGHCKP